MTLRSDIHAALDEVTPPAPHLSTTAVEAAVRGDRRARSSRRGLLLAAVAAALVIVLAGAVATLRLVSPPGRTGPAAPQPGVPAGLVLTSWVRDPSVVTGPYPGYRPQIRMDQREITGAHAVENTSTGRWLVLVRFDPEGQRIFASITADAARACTPGTCAQSHVTAWLDLTSDDVAHWNERANELYAPEGRGGKLLSDPYVQSPIVGPEAGVAFGLSQHDAEVLARRLDHAGG